MSLEISYKSVAHTSILARCSMSDSTPPRDVARLKTLHLAANAMAAARPPCAPLIVSHALSYERVTNTTSSCVRVSPTWRSWKSCPHVYVYVCMCLHTWMSHELSYESVMHFKLSCVYASPTWRSWESCPRVYEYVCMWLHTQMRHELSYETSRTQSRDVLVCVCMTLMRVRSRDLFIWEFVAVLHVGSQMMYTHMSHTNESWMVYATYERDIWKSVMTQSYVQ